MSSVEHCRFRPPRTGHLLMWEVTRYCNLACAHCCTDSSPLLRRTPAVSTESALRLISELPALGITSMTLSGGEPLLRPDLPRLLDLAGHLGVGVYLNTNGYPITRRRAEALRAAGVRMVTISLDSHRAEDHNTIRRNPSAFDRAVRGIRECLRAGVPVRVSGVITPDLLPELEEYVAFVAGLGVPRVVLNTAFPVGRARRNPALVPSPDPGLAARLDTLKHRYAAGGPQLDHSLGADEGGSNGAGRTAAPATCAAGTRILHIAANGDVSGCSWLYKLDPGRFRLGNITRSSLTDILRRVPAMRASLPRTTEGCPLTDVEAETA